MALLYNTLSGSKIEYSHPILVGMLKDILKKENLRVLELPVKELGKPIIRDFVEDIKNNFMGDMACVNLSKGKPFQLIPLPTNYADIRRIKKDPSLPGKYIMSYLSELTIFINNHSSHNLEIHKKFSNDLALFKQFLFPYADTVGQRKEIPLTRIEDILTQSKESGLHTLNITGGNIFEYPGFGELLKILGKYPFNKVFHSHYLDVVERDGLNRLNSFQEKNTQVYLHITLPLVKDKFETAVRFAGTKPGVSFSFSFAVSDEKDLEMFEDIKSRYNLGRYRFNPYYNGSNLDFFQKMVFFDRDSLWAEKPSQKEIFRRMAMNTNDFGNMKILWNGMIYANINNPAIGDINKNSIREAIFNELFHGKSWLKSRSHVLPCKNCLYNFLCPPLSNYEHVLGRNNLCCIYPR